MANWIKTPFTSDKPRGRLLVVVGTYSIGKERIVIGIAKALRTKIYATARKRRICACLEDDELMSLLTDDPKEAQVHMTRYIRHDVANLVWVKSALRLFNRILMTINLISHAVWASDQQDGHTHLLHPVSPIPQQYTPSFIIGKHRSHINNLTRNEEVPVPQSVSVRHTVNTAYRLPRRG